MKPILNPNYGLYRKDDCAVCDSLQIAEMFEKRHDHVIRDIEKLDCSDEFRAPNFGETYYKDLQNKRQKKYFITKDGFVFLVMGYRGKRAAEFKEAYIKRFNDMAGFIRTLYDIKEDFPEFTEAVKLSHEIPKPYHYSNEINMIYSVVLGQSPQAYKKANGITDGSIREYFNTEQLMQVRSLQRIDIGLLYAVPELQRRKEILIQTQPALQAVS